MDKTISVIIPVYNVEKYLKECLDSVLNQSLNNIEIICVNDGSTDTSCDILQEYCIKHENIKVINQKNMGLSIARNEGLKIATGKYVYFVDSDDVLKEGALERIWDVCEQNELDVVYFSFENFCDSDYLKEKYSKHFVGKKRTSALEQVVNGYEMLDFFCKNNQYYVNVWLQVLNRQFILDNNISFYDGLIYEDNLYTFEVLMKAKRTYCIDDILYLKRIREDSIITGKQSSESARGFLVTIIEVLERIKTIKHIDNNIHENIMYILQGLIQRMNRYYNQLEASEQEVFLNNCSLQEIVIFKLLQEN